jgi:hypothetical protein
VACFRPFLEHLVCSDLSRKTIQKHVDNMWVLGGEIIRDLNQTPTLRRAPVERLLADLMEDGGPLLYHRYLRNYNEADRGLAQGSSHAK